MQSAHDREDMRSLEGEGLEAGPSAEVEGQRRSIVHSTVTLRAETGRRPSSRVMRSAVHGVLHRAGLRWAVLAAEVLSPALALRPPD